MTSQCFDTDVIRSAVTSGDNKPRRKRPAILPDHNEARGETNDTKNTIQVLEMTDDEQIIGCLSTSYKFYKNTKMTLLHHVTRLTSG